MSRLFLEKDFLRWDETVPIEDLVLSLNRFNYVVDYEGSVELKGDKLILTGFRSATEEEIAESERELFDDGSDYFDPGIIYGYDEEENEWNSTKQSNTSTADAKSGLSSLSSQWEDVVDAGQNLLAGCSNYLKKLSERLENGREDDE